MAYNQELFETYLMNYVEAQTAFDEAVKTFNAVIDSPDYNEDVDELSAARTDIQKYQEKADKAYRDAIKFLVAYGDAHE